MIKILKLSVYSILLIIYSSWATQAQAPVYHGDSVVLEEGRFSSVLEYKGFEEFEIVEHVGDFVAMEGNVIRAQSGYKDLVPFAYGRVNVDLDVSPPTITPLIYTENFTTEIVDLGTYYVYRIIFDPVFDASYFTYIVTPLGSDDATQAAAYPLSGADKNKIQVQIYNRYGNPAPGKHAFSILVYRT
ncbi:MAG: hypothetical protein KDC53_22330 [Saprospiraceae bacterium]|nr:hypothetical protein [Saprospiraceae bacterium]